MCVQRGRPAKTAFLSLRPLTEEGCSTVYFNLSEVTHALTRLEPARRTTGVAGGKGLIAEGAAAAMSCVTCIVGVSQSVKCGMSGCSTGGVPSLS
jgi:hypothetical protein